MENNFYNSLFAKLVEGDVNLNVQSGKDISMESISLGNRKVKGLGEEKSSVESFNKAFEEAFSSIPREDVDYGSTQERTFNALESLTSAQMKSAVLSYMFLGTEKGFKGAQELSKPSFKGDVKTVGGTSGNVSLESAINSFPGKVSISKESFDGSKNHNAVYFNMIVNMGSARQEDFVEMFMPTVIIKPFETGSLCTLKFASYISDYMMERDDTTLVEDKMNRKPMIKHIFDPKIMGQERTRVVPYNNNDASATKWLVSGIKTTSDVTGETIETGFYKLGEKINILQLSQTARDLKNGTMDNTDNLLPGISLESVLVKFKTASEEHYMEMSTKNLPGRVTSWTGQGHGKDVTLNLHNQVIGFTIGDQDVKKSAATFQTDLAGKTGWKIFVSLDVAGNGNLQTGTVSANCINMKIVEVRDNNNVKKDLTQGEGKTVVDAFTGVEPVGYTLKAYKANTNMRKKGQQIQSDAYSVYFEADYKSPVLVKGPIAKYTGEETDYAEVENLVSAATYASNFAGVKKLVDYVADLEAEWALYSGATLGEDWSYNGNLVNPYFKKDTLDVLDIINSLKSHERRKDLRAALINRITEDAIVMMIKSNYGIAFQDEYKGSKKLTLLIGTDPKIATYLCQENGEDEIKDFFPLTDKIDCKVVSTLNPAVEGKIFMTFSVANAVGQIDQITKLHPGFRLFSPGVTVTIDVTPENGALYQGSTFVPRYEHHLDLKVFTVYEVTNLPETLASIPAPMKSI